MASQDTNLLGRQLDHLQIGDLAGAHTHHSDGNYPPTDTSTSTDSESSFPIALLTPELLANVFVAALPFVHTAKEVKAPSIRQAPMNVSHVCKFWRNVALSTPQLWVQIFFDIRNYKIFSATPFFRHCGALDEDKDERRKTRASAKGMSVASSIPIFLARSVEQALYININFDVSFGDDDHVLARPSWKELEKWDRLRTEVMPLLVKSQFRWTMASISSFPMTWWYGNDEAALREMERLISREGDDQPVLLHTQVVSVDDGPVIGTHTGIRHNYQHAFIIDFSRGSRLVHLSINAAGDTFLRFGKSFSFPNLVELEICIGCQLDADQVSDLLDRSPRLCSLTLRMYREDIENVAGKGNRRMVHLQELQSLQLHNIGSVGDILCRLITPSLQTLGIHPSSGGSLRGVFVRYVCDMLHRSNAQLTQLSFFASHTSCAPEDEVLTFLEANPCLQKLVLHMVGDMDTVLGRLIVRGGTDKSSSNRDLCPNLQSLTLSHLHSRSLPLVMQIAKTHSPAGNARYNNQIDSTRADVRTCHGTAVLQRLDVVLKVTRTRWNGHEYVSDVQPDVDQESSELCARGLEFSVRPYAECVTRFGRSEGGNFYVDESGEVDNDDCYWERLRDGRDFDSIPDSDQC